MTNPFGGGTNTDLGTAAGKVRIEYESVGASSAVGEVQALHDAVAKAGDQFDQMSAKTRVNASEISKMRQVYSQVSANVLVPQNMASQVQSELDKIVGHYRQWADRMNRETRPQLFSLAGERAGTTNGTLDLARKTQNDLNQVSQVIRQWKAQINRDLTFGDSGLLLKPTFDLGAARKAGEAMGIAAAEAFQRTFNPRLPGGGGEGGGGSRSGSSEIKKEERELTVGSTIGAFAGGGKGIGLGTIAGITELGATAAIATASVAALGYALHGGFERLENLDTATVKMRALGYTGQQAQAIMAESLAVVDKTRFSLDEAATTAVQALSAGIQPGADLTAYLKVVANTAELAGTSMSDMGYVFNQVASQGHLMGDQLKDLSDRGVPVLKYLVEDGIAPTQQKAAELASAGGISFAKFEEAMTKGTKNIAEVMGNTIRGSTENLITSIKRLGAVLLAPLFGNATGDASNFAKGLQWVQGEVDKFSAFIKSHSSDLIGFWGSLGIGALEAASGVTQAFGEILKAVGDLVSAFGWVQKNISAKGMDFFGHHDQASQLRAQADSIDAWGKSIRNWGVNGTQMSQTLHGLENNVRSWEDSAKSAANQTQDLTNVFIAAAPKTITFSDALDKLNIKADAAAKGISGTTEDFKSLLLQLSTAKAPIELVDTVTRLHQQFNDGGRAARDFSTSIDKLGDSSISADDKAKSLIDSLRQLGGLPKQDELKNYNQVISETTGYQSHLVDHLDATGQALVNMDGSLNSSSKNGQTLVDTLEKYQQATFALAASGEATPDQAWQRTHDALTLVLRDFGIFGPAADQVINKYIKPEKDFTVLFNTRNEPEVQKEITALLLQMNDAKAKGDNKMDFTVGVSPTGAKQLQETLESLGAKVKQYDPATQTMQITVPPDSQLATQKDQIEATLNKDPTKLDSVLKVTTTQQDIISQVLGNEKALHIPTILDVQSLPKTVAGANIAQAGIDALNKSGAQPPGPAQIPGLPPVSGSINAPGSAYTGFAPFGHGNDDVGSVSYINKLPDSLSMASDDQIKALLAKNPEIDGILKARVTAAQAQGQSFSEAFAEGINSSDEAVKQAIIKLAQLAADGLGHSPALYGPLSGDGWTYNRGQTFTQAWADGIAAQAGSAKTAVSGAAQAAVTPLDDQITQFVKDMTELSSFGSHLESLASQVADIGFGFANIANTMSHGRLSPKTYVPDPTIDTRRGRLGAWSPTSVDPNGPGGQGGPTGQPPGALPANAGRQDIANYIVSKALSQGYSREQANAILTQAVGESGLDPGISGGSQSGDTVLGIFQEKSAFATAGGISPDQRTNAQSNIDAYFSHLSAAGGPGAAGDIKSFLAGVSGGGPAHPANIAANDSWNKALAAAAPLIAGFTPTTGQPAAGIPTATTTPGNNPNPSPAGLPVLPNAGLPGAGTNYNPDWMRQHGFAPLFNKAGGDATQAEIPPWLHAIADKFGLPISSHADSTLHGGAAGKGNTINTQGDWAVDIGGPGSDPAKMEALAQFLQQNYQGDIAQLIHRSGTTDYGIAGGQNVGGPLGKGTYYTTGEGYSVHGDHVHVAFALPPGAGAPTGQPGVTTTPVPAAGAPNPPAAQADWTDVKGKDGQIWKYFKDKDGKDRWVPPGSPTPQIKDGLAYSPNGLMWLDGPGGSGVLGQVPKAGGSAAFSGQLPSAPTTPTPSTPSTVTAVATQVQDQNGKILGVLQPGETQLKDSSGNVIYDANAAGTAPSSPWNQPVSPTAGSGVLSDLQAKDPQLAAAIAMGQGGMQGNWQDAVPLLQHLDSLIADQNAKIDANSGNIKLGIMPTDAQRQQALIAKDTSDALGSIKSGLQSGFGLKEQPSQLEQAQSFIQGASGIASDMFQTFDAGLQAISATQHIGDTLVRGVHNTQDIYNMVGDVQKYITLAQKVFQTAGDITSMAGQFTGGSDFGATSAAGGMLSLVGQALGAVNTAIDLGKEGYDIATKYIGRALTSWLGFPGAADAKFLLDEKTGQLQAYTSANPNMKTTFNTLGREANPGAYADSRSNPSNQFNIYQGPGQDPRDTMNDAMFAVKASGVGAFGYAK